MVTIEVNGQPLQVKPGAMLIEVTDEAGISIPRFCYHKKLSISANCRQCLVEVENAPKPMPACATPVMDGMKVQTRSPKALAAQKGTMEFLLINHPLDCPICDQGGECELQDVAMGYGSDVSRFAEGKRVVPQKDIGPLIATDMTRCIHCTRCVRFGDEIAGIRELGATGRGEHMVIGTYVAKTVDSELSGNIIDLCPVGALTSKPFRFSARAWELVQVEGIAPHDAVGSNINLHLRGNRVMRVHPRDNESINESWISDRDRFSYEGLNSDNRLTSPMVKKNGEWQESSWEMALEMAAAGLREVGSGDQIGSLVSPTSTLEELYLAQKITRGLGSNHIDHRLRQGDFRLDGAEPELAWLGMPIADLEQLDAALLVGCNLRKEQPILGHRLRKAVLDGADIRYITPLQLDLNYVAEQQVCSPAEMVSRLAAIAGALGASTDGALGKLIKAAKADEAAKAAANALKQANNACVMLGALASAHPDYSILCGLAAAVAEAAAAKLALVPAAANSVGARLAGAAPHLLPGAKRAADSGNDALKMLKLPLKAYLLMGVEPAADCWDPAVAQSALKSADLVVALTTHRTASLDSCADIQLPVAAFAETAGSYVNAAGEWQSFRGAVKPQGEARPAWKVLRVLGNLLDLQGFDYTACEEVRDELAAVCDGAIPDNQVGRVESVELASGGSSLMRVGEVPIYASDLLVRQAKSLQQTGDARAALIRVNGKVARQAGLEDGASVVADQNGNRAELLLQVDERVPAGCVWIPSGLEGTQALGPQFGEVTLEKA
ncbi:NADH-quinone oxidoreductase subunit G [endosymbiont of Tevnia jerichonana (vent Tica)]|uniref:NADH-quinone oxidoreductase n=3 Tax=Gammaproteobacteria TaxID=1236 RepID=G2FGB5_9GAMM|nr:NADH-quinone oxidoreductase subunit G [endosymbiont of Tevnia jerichonana (vent Tica)]